MIGLAACLVVGEVLLVLTIPKVGFLYLPLVALLATAIAIIPFREYRRVERTAAVLNGRPLPEIVKSKEIVASRLQNLRPQLRTSALVVLGFGFVTAIGLLFMPVSWVDRILPTSLLFLAIVFFGRQLLKERNIVASYAPTLARIVGFEKGGRHGRIAIYEYESPLGIRLTARGGSVHGFSVGMTVPILYSTANADESLPVTDFIFYTVRAELP